MFFAQLLGSSVLFLVSQAGGFDKYVKNLEAKDTKDANLVLNKDCAKACYELKDCKNDSASKGSFCLIEGASNTGVCPGIFVKEAQTNETSEVKKGTKPKKAKTTLCYKKNEGDCEGYAPLSCTLESSPPVEAEAIVEKEESEIEDEIEKIFKEEEGKTEADKEVPKKKSEKKLENIKKSHKKKGDKKSETTQLEEGENVPSDSAPDTTKPVKDDKAKKQHEKTKKAKDEKEQPKPEETAAEAANASNDAKDKKDVKSKEKKSKKSIETPVSVPDDKPEKSSEIPADKKGLKSKK